MTNRNVTVSLLSRDDDYLEHHIKHLQNIMKKTGLENTPLILDEWDSTLWQRDPVSDTCYHSSYITRNILKNADHVTAMAQAVISDYSEETLPENGLFFGAAGIFTYNGLRKNIFYCYQMLSDLGTEKLACGDGWACIKHETTLQIILWYNCHYHRSYGYQLKMISKYDRYAVFLENKSRTFHCEISGLPAGILNLREQKIGRDSGSIYDKWVEMGSPDELTSCALNYLDRSSIPSLHIRKIEHNSPNLNLKYTLNPHDVLRVDITPE
ncbi:MAG: GH39 family glycosyl hydrolase [Bilifractor sp.]